jgi:hypothetical protein
MESVFLLPQHIEIDDVGFRISDFGCRISEVGNQKSEVIFRYIGTEVRGREI